MAHSKPCGHDWERKQCVKVKTKTTIVTEVKSIGGKLWSYIKKTVLTQEEQVTKMAQPTEDEMAQSTEDDDSDFVENLGGGFRIITMPVKEEWKNAKHKVRKCAIRECLPSDKSGVTRKTILLVGATGAGKSTLLDGMFNYVLGVKWDDNYRLKLINLTNEERQRERKGQALSQTEWVTAYTIPCDTETTLPYDLVVVDTPGFGDTRGIDQDNKIVSQMKYLFENTKDHGVDNIDGICFLVKAPDARLTATQRYIFDTILSMFGKDVKENIYIMVTFADGKKPPVIASLKESDMPFSKYFKFNNSALYTHPGGQSQKSEESDTDEEDEFSQMFWDVGMKSFEKFFSALETVEPRSLTLSAEVLKQREQLKCDLTFIEMQIQEAAHKMERLKQEKFILEQHEAQIRANENFEYSVDEEKMVKKNIKKGRHVTNCSTCHQTCHTNCAFADDKDKKNCGAMDSVGNCKICTKRCHWSSHYNQGYIFELVVEKVTRTYKELKERYESAQEEKKGKVDIIRELQRDRDHTESLANAGIRKAKKCLEKLNEISLKPDPLSEVDYIDLLIADEKNQGKYGFQMRIASLETLKTSATLVNKLRTGKAVLPPK